MTKGRLRPVLEGHGPAAAKCPNRHVPANSGALDAGDRCQALFELPKESRLGRGISIFGVWQIHVGDHQTIHSPSGMAVKKSIQASDEEPRSGQENQSKSDFANNERTPEPMLRAAHGGPTHA